MDQGVERRLAAILAADVVGYSRLMEADEAGTHARIKAVRKELIEPRIAERHGRVVKLTGDGALVEFPSVVEAVLCAGDVQRVFAERNADVPQDQRIEFRIGVNLGDVIFDENDIYGDGVNVAARLQTLAEPGGICVSRTVYNHVRNKVDLAFEPMGEHKVKNIAEPITVYRVLPGPRGAAKTRSAALIPRLRGRRPAAIAAAMIALLAAGAIGAWYALSRPGATPPAAVAQTAASGAAQGTPALPLPDKPSIAVLPFENLSGEERYERLADGLTEDIITDLSRFRDLFVIARNSTFVYKDQPTDVRQIAHELGVQYVLEGSLQAEGDRARTTAQLVDATTGNHVWSERYDRPLDDVFAIQDEVTQNLVGTLGGYWGRVAQAVREQARRKPPESLEAYELYLIGIEYKHRHTKEDTQIARDYLHRAIELDPNLARAYVGLAWTHLNDAVLGWTDDRTRSLEAFAGAARQAVALDDADAEAHLTLGFAHLYYDQNLAQGAREIERALALGPSHADVHAIVAWGTCTKLDTAERDLELARRAMRLNPHYPEWYLYGLGYAGYFARQYVDVVEALKRVSESTVETHLYLALSLAELGRNGEASAAVKEVLALDPDFSAERHIFNDVFLNEAAITHFLDSNEKAGLPVCATEAQLAKYPDMKRLAQCEAQRVKS